VTLAYSTGKTEEGKVVAAFESARVARTIL
jgi:hypothetical protein